MSVSVKLTVGYEDTDYTRQYILDCDDSLAAYVKTRIKAINSSLLAGTDDGLADFFVGEYGEKMVAIVEAHLISQIETPLTIGG